MLGEELCDPHGVEHGGTLRGMGLLHARTVFSREKTRTQISGTLLEKAGLFQEYQETQVTGYEIHMGQTENLGGCRELIRLENNRVDALSREDGLVMGSYLHGLFDTPGMAESVIRKLMLDQGLDPADWQFDLEAHKEAEYDKLADLVRRSLDMKKIYEILEAGIQDGE